MPEHEQNAAPATEPHHMLNRSSYAASSMRVWASVTAVVGSLLTIIGLVSVPDDLRRWVSFFQSDIGRWVGPVILAASLLALGYSIGRVSRNQADGAEVQFETEFTWATDGTQTAHLLCRNIGPAVARKVTLSAWRGPQMDEPVAKIPLLDRSTQPELLPGSHVFMAIDFSRADALPDSVSWRVSWSDDAGTHADEGEIPTIQGRPRGDTRSLPLPFGVRFQNDRLQIDFKGLAVEVPRPSPSDAGGPRFEQYVETVIKRFAFHGVHLDAGERSELQKHLKDAL